MSKTTKTEVSPIGTLTRKTNRTEFSENTWVVFRGPNGERKPMLFSSKLSRDRVRTAYAKITGTSHNRTRSRRLKNY
jgi:hypothetical protein